MLMFTYIPEARHAEFGVLRDLKHTPIPISMFHDQRQNITKFRWNNCLLAKSGSASAWTLFSC